MGGFTNMFLWESGQAAVLPGHGHQLYVSQARIGTNKSISFLGHPCAARMELTRRSVPQPACCPSKSASQGLRLLLFSSARLYTTCRAGARAQTPPYACSPHSRPTQRKPA